MPSYRTFTASSPDYSGTLEAATSGQDSEHVLWIKTTRGAQCWLSPADLQGLLDFGQAELAAWQKAEGQPTIGYPICNTTSREGSSCILIDGHEHHEFGDPVHTDAFGRRWGMAFDPAAEQ